MCQLSGLIVPVIARILLGAVFMLSSIAKLSSMEGFELYIFSFSFAPFDLCSLAARFVVIAEFILGAFLLLRIFIRPVNLITAISLAGFSVFLLWRVISGDEESCHCMGDLVDMNPVQSLIKNIILAILLVLGWKSAPKVYKYPKLLPISVITLVSIAVFMMSPPDFYFRNSSESNDLSAEAFRPVTDSLNLSEGRRIVCFYSATCEHCRHCASKMAGIIRRHDIAVDSVSVIFMQTHENQDSVVTEFYRNNGEGLELRYSTLHPYTFLPLTNGAMPIVILMDEGEPVREYDYISIDEKEIASFMR
jgi:uncharacterized membrane protein YphA (DoxX/SURF4 family)